MPDPQALLIKHRRGEHVDDQMAAVAPHQRPFTRLVLAALAALDQHCMTGWHRFAEARAQFCRACRQLPGQVQVFQGHLPHHLGSGVAEHLLGTGIEGADHAAQIRGNDRHLGCSVQHTA
ncbi:hypothetical protein D3C84_863830 [compost metagenome]